jgi:superfamily II DNA helicase RecQ
VQREFVDHGENSFWALAVEYMPVGGGDAKKRSRVDYKEVLSPDDFLVFAKLREWRKGVAAEEGVPVYTVFSNEQLAKIAETRVQTEADLAGIDGIGKSRLEKYAKAVIEMVTSSHSDAAESEDK